jgi:hypothetical protein
LALKKNAHLLYANLDKVINPNVVFLRRCQLCDCDIAKHAHNQRGMPLGNGSMPR